MKSEKLLPEVLETINELILRHEYDNMGLGEWDCNLLHIWEYMTEAVPVLVHSSSNIKI